MTRRKLPHERLKPGRKPKPRPELDAQPPALPAEVQATEVSAAPQVRLVAARWDDPLQRNRPIDAMDESELRQYGLQIGLSRRDASDLGVERLRVACKQRINDLIEEL